jgi:hypothetical protein
VCGRKKVTGPWDRAQHGSGSWGRSPVGGEVSLPSQVSRQMGIGERRQDGALYALARVVRQGEGNSPREASFSLSSGGIRRLTTGSLARVTVPVLKPGGGHGPGLLISSGRVHCHQVSSSFSSVGHIAGSLLLSSGCGHVQQLCIPRTGWAGDTIQMSILGRTPL